MKGIFYLLLFYALGMVLSHVTHNFLPGSVLGMLFFYIA